MTEPLEVSFRVPDYDELILLWDGETPPSEGEWARLRWWFDGEEQYNETNVWIQEYPQRENDRVVVSGPIRCGTAREGCDLDCMTLERYDGSVLAAVAVKINLPVGSEIVIDAIGINGVRE